jgi:hypothetical protein
MTKKEHNKEHDRKVKMVIMEQLFDKLLKETRKNSRIRPNQNYKNWKKTITNSKGSISIRCQANVNATKNKNEPRQCLRKAMKNCLVCQTHGGKRKIQREEITLIKQSLGIYTGEGLTALQKELEEIENITPEQLQDTTDELKLGIALLRNYLKNTDDEKIAKSPGQLMWIIGEIARLKKENYEMKHSKDVSFTRDQVTFLFSQFYLILIRLVKDQDLLQKISNEIDRVGKYIGKEGFKEIS